MNRHGAIKLCLAIDKQEAVLRSTEYQLRNIRYSLAKEYNLKPGEFGFEEPAVSEITAELSEDQKKAILEWLRFGEDSLGTAHLGYFARGGWGYETLKGIVKISKCSKCGHKAHEDEPCLEMSGKDCLCRG